MGEDETHRLYYLVLEHLTGGTLKARMLGRPWDLAAAVDVLRPLADALDYAHGRARPVIHRDLKPSNVMFDDYGRLKISDFGIAHILSPRGFGNDGDGSLTQAGAVLGTPFYMAPEQARGEPPATAADRYAVATIAYELLTGQVPFRAETPQAVLARVLMDALPLPREVNPKITRAVEVVLCRALAKDSAQRFATGAEFVESLVIAGAAPD